MCGFGVGAEARAGKVGACVVGIARAHANRLVESEIRGQHFQCMNRQRTIPRQVHIPANVAIATLSKVCRTNGAIPFESSCELAFAQRTKHPCYVIL